MHGFRWKDHADWKSCAPEATPSALDQNIGTGDGTRAHVQLIKRYGALYAPYDRPITKPGAGSLRIAVAQVPRTAGVDYDVDPATGLVTFRAGHIPALGAAITAGFEFDVPVRFDTDKLEVNLSGFRHGAIPAIPIVEIRL